MMNSRKSSCLRLAALLLMACTPTSPSLPHDSRTVDGSMLPPWVDARTSPPPHTPDGGAPGSALADAALPLTVPDASSPTVVVDTAAGVGSETGRSDALVSDAPVRDSSWDRDAAGVSGCGLDEAGLCADFEDGRLDPALWSSVQSGGKVTIDDVRPHGGTRSLHLSVPPGGQSKAYVETRTFPLKETSFWVRFWMFVAPRVPGRPTESNVHQAVMLLHGIDNSGRTVQLEIGFGDQREFVGNFIFFNGGTFAGERAVGSVEKVPEARWHCLELEVVSSAGKVHRRHHLDGVLMTGQINQSYEKPLTFQKVAFGPNQFHKTPVLSDVFIDDIRVTANRVGCAP